MLKNQENVINYFLENRALLEQPSDYQVLEVPDQAQRNKPACDALARVGTSELLIEHTTIDSFPDQRADGARFMRCLGPLQEELEGRFG